MTATDDDDDGMLQFDEPGGNRSLVLEDDGRVAYAYLLIEGRIVGDVWLYNVAAAPAAISADPEHLPFLNPSGLASDSADWRFDQDPSVSCRWDARGVTVMGNGVAMARLEPGAKPGWSRYAIEAGPLAMPIAAWLPPN